MIRSLFVLALLISFAPVSAESLTPDEQRMADWIDAHSDDAIALLKETVDIPSGSLSLEGVREVGKVMRRELDALGLATEWIEMPERDGDIATGHGIQDMKSGNVVMVYALLALQEIGALGDIPVVAFYTGDEEKSGRPLTISRKQLIEAGQWADISLGFEEAQNYDGQDWATIARRSSSNWMLTVEGKQSHSSSIFNDATGAGAIFEAARILDGFYETVRGEEYLTFNACTIQGGTEVEYDPGQNRGSTFGKTNVVPRTVVVHGGMRTISQQQLDRAREAMRKVVAENLPHTSATITFTDGYPPMAPTEGNQALQREISAINVALGRGPMPALDPLRRGAADISFVAPYTDALAGLGALGGDGHTPNEYLDLSTMSLAIKRAAILIYRLRREDAID